MKQEKIGAFIANLRKEKGWTQKELASQLGVSDKAISKWETGKGLPDMGMLIPVSELLGITVDELLTGGKRDASKVGTGNEPTKVIIDYAAKIIERTKRTYRLIPVGILGVLILTLVIGISILTKYIPMVQIDPESMPSGVLQYKDQENSKQLEDLYISGYHWEIAEPSTSEKVWETVGPNNFFSRVNGVNEILPGDKEVHLQIVWLDPPDNVIIKKWPLIDWTPDNSEASHSEGVDVARSWETHWKKTDIGFDVERGSIYGVWIYYGNAWMEYSFIVPGDDPARYDYLGYLSGFDNPNEEEVTLDTVEWINASNADRIKALHLNQEEDFPTGFYIYNPTKEARPMRLTEDTKYLIIDPETGDTPIMVDKTEFFNYLNQFPDADARLFWVKETDGNIEYIKTHFVKVQ